MIFYTYMWLRENGSPYYIGKGLGRRAFISDAHSVKCPRDKDRIIVQEWMSEQQAFEAEKFLISCYGRIDNGTGCLRNLTDGGEGASGHVHSEEHKHKIGAANKGISRNLGRKPSDEARQKMSRSHKGIPKPDVSRALKGKPKSLETRRRISETKRKQAINGR